MSDDFRKSILVLAISACFSQAHANPTGGTVMAGQASISASGNTLTVTNSANAIINWQSFSIGRDEVTRFVQPNAQSAVLSRVVGSDPSLLLGRLQSNGRVFLINPAGILVGPTARIDVAGLVASTLNLTDANFLAGVNKFEQNSGAGSVINQGAIRTTEGGFVYLVAPVVSNSGQIGVRDGSVVLAAGDKVEIADTALPGIRVEVVGDGVAENLGVVMASAGQVGLYGALVRNRGSIDTSSIETVGGRIFLRAAKQATVDGGVLSATGVSGGHIQIEAQHVSVGGGAVIDASGTDAGGTILIGGGFQGKDPALINSQSTSLDATSVIRVDASGSGNGGKVAVWSDGTTSAAGTISARGGNAGGDGGFVEVSGKQRLVFGATVDTSASNGNTGILLLDPTDIVISSSSTTSGGFSSGTYSENTASASTVAWSDLVAQLANNNVVIQTSSSGTGSGNIDVASTGGAYTSTNSLSLLAENNLSTAAGGGATIANLGTGAIKLVSGWSPSSGYANPTATNASAGVTGNMTINGSITSGGPVDLTSKGSLAINALVSSSQGPVSLRADGDVSINLPLTGTSSYVDDSYFVYNFPSNFTFNFFGTSYTSAYISSNGIITFGSGTGAYSDSIGGLGSYKVIAPAWNDWEINTSQRESIQITRPNTNRLAFKWDVARYYHQPLYAVFETVLNRSNGNITFNYGSANSTFAGDVTIGISDGAGTTIASQLMSEPSFNLNRLKSTTFAPAGSSYTETVATSSLALQSTGNVLYSSDQGFGFSTSGSSAGNIALQAATSITISSLGGTVSGVGGIVSPSLSVSANSGIDLAGVYNQVAGLTASTGSGGLVFLDNNPGLSNSLDVAYATIGGDVDITNYGATLVGTAAPGIRASGAVTITANSPLTVGQYGISSTGGGAVSLAANNSGALTLTGPVSSIGGTVSLFGGTVTGADIFAPGAFINGVATVSAPPTSVVAPIVNEQQSAVAVLDEPATIVVTADPPITPGQLVDSSQILPPYFYSTIDSSGVTVSMVTFPNGTIGGDVGEFAGSLFQEPAATISQRGRDSEKVQQCSN